jgi:hypothetical protein
MIAQYLLLLSLPQWHFPFSMLLCESRERFCRKKELPSSLVRDISCGRHRKPHPPIPRCYGQNKMWLLPWVLQGGLALGFVTASKGPTMRSRDKTPWRLRVGDEYSTKNIVLQYLLLSLSCGLDAIMILLGRRLSSTREVLRHLLTEGSRTGRMARSRNGNGR